VSAVRDHYFYFYVEEFAECDELFFEVLWALQGDKRAPADLIKKSLRLTGILLEFVGKARKGQGQKMASSLLKDGSAYKTMAHIVRAQGGKLVDPDTLKPAKYTFTLRAEKTGKISCISNATIAKTARLAGAPVDVEAGVYIHKGAGMNVKKGEAILTVYAPSKHKLKNATRVLKRMGCVEF